MKLPEFVVGGPAQSARLVSPEQAGAVGRAIANDVGRATAQIGAAVQEYDARYRREKTDHELRLAAAQFDTDLTEFASKYDKPLYTPEDIKALGLADSVSTKEKYVDDQGEVRERDRLVPWEEVYPTVISRQAEQFANLAAEQITDPLAQANYRLSQTRVLNALNADVTKRAEEARREAMMVQEAAQITRALEQGNHAGAIELLRGSLYIDNDKRAEAIQAVRVKEVEDGIDQAVATQDAASMQSYLDDLSSKDYDGPLPPAKQKARANELRSNLAIFAQAGERQMKQERAIAGNDAKVAMDAALRGDMTLVELQKQTAGNQVLWNPETSTEFVQQREYALLINNSETLTGLAGGSQADRVNYLAGLPESTSEERRYKELATEYLTNVADRWAEDSMTMAEQYGWEVEPLTSLLGDPVALSAQLSNRLALHQQVQQVVGVSAGPLTKPEAEAFAMQLSTMTPNEKLVTYRMLTSNHGIKAQPIFAQIGKEAGGVGWLAGMLVTEGGEDVAKKVLRGEELMAGEVKVIPNPNDIGAMLVNQHQGLFGGPTATDTAVMAVTAYLTAEHYEAGKAGEPHTAGRKDIDKAVAAIYGTPIEVKNGWFGAGRKFLPPTRTMTGEQWYKWLKTMPKEKLGNIKGLTPTEAHQRLNEGSLQPAALKRRGHYMLLDANNGSLPVRDKNNSVYIMKYAPHE